MKCNAMMNFLRKLIHEYYFFQVIASKIYVFFYFFVNKKKIKIYYEDKCWVHETFMGKYASTHPIRKAEENLIKELIFFLKHYKCKKNDIIFDAGAGIGTEVIFFSKLVGPKGKVYALEANPKIFRLLIKTIKINNLTNVVPINNAAYKISNKKIKFNSDEKNWLISKISSTKGNTEIITKSFDDIIKEFKINKINFAKFNIEGAEKYLITGRQIFLKNTKNICVSCHDFLDDKNSKTYEIISKALNKNKFNFQEGNNKIKNLHLSKYFFIYATKNINFKKSSNFIFNNYYKFYHQLLK